MLIGPPLVKEGFYIVYLSSLAFFCPHSWPSNLARPASLCLRPELSFSTDVGKAAMSLQKKTVQEQKNHS